MRAFLRRERAERVLAALPGGLDAWEIESRYDPAWRLHCGHPDDDGRLPDDPSYQPSRREKRMWDRYFPGRGRPRRWWGVR